MLIVLSSHDEFQFAKEAIKYNIKEYVLKNECSKEKLSEILYACQERIQSRQMDSDLTREFMERVLKSNIPEKGLSIIEKSFPKLAGKLFLVAAADIKRKNIRKNYDDPEFSLRFEGIIGSSENLSFYLFSIESHRSNSNYNFNYAGLLSEKTGKKVSCGKLCRDTGEILPECRNSWIGYQSLFYSSERYCSGLHHYSDFDANAVDSLCETVISDIRSYLKEKTLTNLHEINSYFLKNHPTEVEDIINIYLALVDTFFYLQQHKITEYNKYIKYGPLNFQKL